MKLTTLIIALVLSAAILCSCGSPPSSSDTTEPTQQQSDSGIPDEGRLAAEIAKTLSRLYTGQSPGLWSDVTIISYVCDQGVSESKSLTDGTKVLQYLIMPLAIIDDGTLTKLEYYYLTKWTGSSCHCEPIKRVNLNGGEIIKSEELNRQYEACRESGSVAEELTVNKTEISKEIDILLYDDSDFQTQTVEANTEEEPKTANERALEAWENRNDETPQTEQPQQATEPDPSPAPEPAPTPTLGQQNALRSAKDYVDMTGFSYTGLIEQLEYEGYSHDEAVYGADNCGADWSAEAAESAQDYIDMMAFSRQGLIDQLLYEGYTQEQAEYGASAVGY